MLVHPIFLHLPSHSNTPSAGGLLARHVEEVDLVEVGLTDRPSGHGAGGLRVVEVSAKRWQNKHMQRVLILIAAGLALPAFLLAGLLLLVSDTAGGRLTAAAIVLGGPALIWLGLVGRRAWRKPTALLVAALGAWMAAVMNAPDAEAVKATGLSVYLGDVGHARWSLANLVPEVDQFALGSHLVPAVDPFIDRAQAERIRRLFGRVYDGLRADPRFAAAGSTMNAAYAELLGGRWQNAHLYRYPAASAGPKRPVLLFLHGSGGNFLGYLWVLKRFADANGWAVIAPDYGFGNWAHGDPDSVFEQALGYIDAQPDLDGERVLLAGLSNGGLGVARALQHAPDRFRAVVLFSAVTHLFDEEVPVRGPVFVLHGGADRRIPLPFIERTVRRLRARGVEVDLTVRATDHFLFFEDDDAVDAVLEAAAQAVLRAPRSPTQKRASEGRRTSRE